MKKRKSAHMIKIGIASVALLSVSVVALSFCQSKGMNSTSPSVTSSSSTQTKQSTSTSVSTKSGNESTETSAATHSTASQSAPSQPAQSSVSGMNVQSLEAGDFSTVSGTWQNYRGLTLVFDQNGVVALQGDEGKVSTSSLNMTQGSVKDGYYSAGIGEYNKWAAAISFVPAGIPTAGDHIVYQNDCIIIAQDISGEYEPFYRVSDSTAIPEERYIPSEVVVDEEQSDDTKTDAE